MAFVEVEAGVVVGVDDEFEKVVYALAVALVVAVVFEVEEQALGFGAAPVQQLVH